MSCVHLDQICGESIFNRNQGQPDWQPLTHPNLTASCEHCQTILGQPIVEYISFNAIGVTRWGRYARFSCLNCACSHVSIVHNSHASVVHGQGVTCCVLPCWATKRPSALSHLACAACNRPSETGRDAACASLCCAATCSLSTARCRCSSLSACAHASACCLASAVSHLHTFGHLSEVSGQCLCLAVLT